MRASFLEYTGRGAPAARRNPKPSVGGASELPALANPERQRGMVPRWRFALVSRSRAPQRTRAVPLKYACILGQLYSATLRPSSRATRLSDWM